MPTNHPAQINYDFSYGEVHPHHVFPARDIDLVTEDNPGIYAWYARILGSASTANDLSFYTNIFASKSIDVRATAPLGEEYTGELQQTPAYGGAPSRFTRMIATASTVFSPPIYIGISTNVKRRLQTHLRSLENTLTSVPNLNLYNTTISDNEVDTDIESSMFGERIGKLLREQKIINTNCLFLKVIYASPNNRIELYDTEHFVNRIFTPVCGRR